MGGSGLRLNWIPDTFETSEAGGVTHTDNHWHDETLMAGSGDVYCVPRVTAWHIHYSWDLHIDMLDRITVTNYEFCTISRCCANVVWQLLKTLERGFDGKGVAVLPQSETINNVEEESVWKTLSFCKCTFGSHILTIFKTVSICRSSSTIVASSIIIFTVWGFQKHMILGQTLNSQIQFRCAGLVTKWVRTIFL